MTGLFDLPFEEEPSEVRTESSSPTSQRRVYSVTSLNNAIRQLLETSFFEVWVEGELSNCRAWQTGHLYFTLKDSGGQIKAVMFRSALRYLRFKPEDGLHVIARGRVSVYDPRGEYQIVCEHMQPHGLGALQLAFEQLKTRLQAEGLFEPDRKRALPVLPRKIGIVTSLDGAALRDIVKILRRRHPNAHLVICPTRVQGEGAAADVAAALRAIARVPSVDVVIVGRGGGSVEDLWAFNEEPVARAIAASPIPIISAIGHETDFTIADFVADVRAPTPSAAAELVVSRTDEFRDRINRLDARAQAALKLRIHRLRSELHVMSARPGFAGWRGHFAGRMRHVAELASGLRQTLAALVARRSRRFGALQLRLESRDLRRYLGSVQARVAAGKVRLAAAASRQIQTAQARLMGSAGRLDSLSPLAVLGRGYAVCWNEDRSIIVRDSETVETGDTVLVTLHRGELKCAVTDRRRATTQDEPEDGHPQ